MRKIKIRCHMIDGSVHTLRTLKIEDPDWDLHTGLSNLLEIIMQDPVKFVINADDQGKIEALMTAHIVSVEAEEKNG